VNADGSEDYASIQSAVTAAKPGDIILVEPGTYNENVVVNKQLNIRSTGGASVTSVIADSADDHVFEIIADEVTINGFSVTGDYVASGIYLNSSSNSIIENNNFSHNLDSIYLFSSSNNLIENNNILQSNTGIVLDSSPDNKLTDNVVSNSSNGIYLDESCNNTLESNIVSDTNNAGGINLLNSCNNFIWNNYFSGYGSYGTNTGNVWNITKTQGTNIAGGPYLGGNYWANSNGTGFSQTCNDSDGISDSYYSLDAENIDYLPLVEVYYPSIITVNTSGSADYTSIQSAVTAANPSDIILVEPGIYKENIVVNKQLNISSTGGAAVTNVAGIDSDFSYAFVITADGVKVSGFSIFTHRVGIDLYSNNNTIENNNLSCNLLGFSLDSSSDNIIKNNKVTNNNYRGIYLESSCNNLIYNNFFNNSDNIGFNGTNTGNVWNITKTQGANIAGGPSLGGNCWASSDGTGFSQTCNDSNGDGISDSYYSLDGNNIDYLPLVEQYIDIPPSSVGGLSETNAGSSWIEWSWVNPQDYDFSHSMICLDGVFRENVSGTSYTAEGLDENTTYEIQIRTVDYAGNVNNSQINDTATTDNDWNPWNDPDSENGAVISLHEVQDAIVYWKYSTPCPETGYIMSLNDMQDIVIYWKYQVPM
jgi:parallel beta-helix repeat protein